MVGKAKKTKKKPANALLMRAEMTRMVRVGRYHYSLLLWWAEKHLGLQDTSNLEAKTEGGILG